MDDPSRSSTGWSVPEAAAYVLRPIRSLVDAIVGDDPPLELRIVGRTVVQAMLIGLAVGAAAAAFGWALDHAEALLLDRGAGYPRLHAAGAGHDGGSGPLRLWLIAILPALGALVAGALSRWAPEIKGGGGDAMIAAFHHQGGAIRRRVALLKPLASIVTLATGGAGGREGPTMLLGGAVGAWATRLLPTTARERRVLMLSGVAAGISAVFRTPLGAALLAIEVVYRDDFESDALIPAVLASVVAFSLSSSFEGATPLFGELPTYVFRWQHLPLYAVTALVVAAAAVGFVAMLRAVERAVAPIRTAWLRPAAGALALGLFAVTVVLVAREAGVDPAHLAVLGGGYGNSQLAITGDPGLIGGSAALVLLAAAALRVVGSALTLGSGGSAGDFAPSLAIGALVGGALGHAAARWVDVDGLAPGAFALVGMATFYGGVAKVPLAATVLVCEMAGSYDLLVPLMLSQAIAFVALRQVALYPAQLPGQRWSPAHAGDWARHHVARVTVGDVLIPRAPATLSPRDDADRVLRVLADHPSQPVFPVIDGGGQVAGLVTGASTREIAAADDSPWAVAADLMVPPVVVPASAPLLEVAELMLRHDLRAVPVVAADGTILGLCDEHDLSRALLRGAGE